MSRRLVLVVALCGCVHAEVVQRPEAPLNEGIVKFLDEGTDSAREKMKNDAYLKMREVCGGGTYAVVAESNHPDAEVSPGDVVVAGGWHFLKFKCLAGDAPAELLPCCANVSLECGNPSCTCSPHVCGGE
jgi:hypothetical protein